MLVNDILGRLHLFLWKELYINNLKISFNMQINIDDRRSTFTSWFATPAVDISEINKPLNGKVNEPLNGLLIDMSK